MSENRVLEWAVDVIAAAPPMQNVVAFLIVAMLSAPLISAGWRAFRKRETPELPLPAAAPQALIQETPWLIQTLTRVQFDVEQLGKDLASLSGQLAVIEKIIRRRAPRK